MQFRAVGALPDLRPGTWPDPAPTALVTVAARPASVLGSGPMREVPEVIGNLEVVGLLGKGAMGEVYEGRDKTLGRRVALKILGARHRESTEFKTRFTREGRALAAMNHPNIV